MDSRRAGFQTRIPVVIGALIVSGGLAGLGTPSRVGDAALRQSIASTTLTHSGCHYCGIVERVREVVIAPPQYGVSTVAVGRDEAIVMLLSALNGATVSAVQSKIYEVSVRMDDGSIRAVRGARMPDWRPGERVKVVKGQVEPLS